MILNLKRYILVISLFSPIMQAQIVNIEQFRLSSDTSKWRFSEQVNLSLLQNTQRLIGFNNNLGVQFRLKRFSTILLSNLDLSSTDENDIERSGFLHLRFENRLNANFSLEYFTQAQKDVPLKINQRYLLGAGLRVALRKRKVLSFYTGHLFMLEYDEEIETGNAYQNVRLSSYLNFNWHPSEALTFLIIAYYQPRLDKFSDYRLAIQGQLAFRLWKSLSFTFNARYAYDAFPVDLDEIPQLTYKLSNGVSFKF
jgi:hypothetical protein